MDGEAFINEQVARRKAAMNSQHEVLILAGCFLCGRRLIEDDKPIKGTMAVGVATEHDPFALIPLPLCADCYVSSRTTREGFIKFKQEAEQCAMKR